MIGRQYCTSAFWSGVGLARERKGYFDSSSIGLDPESMDRNRAYGEEESDQQQGDLRRPQQNEVESKAVAVTQAEEGKGEAVVVEEQEISNGHSADGNDGGGSGSGSRKKKKGRK